MAESSLYESPVHFVPATPTLRCLHQVICSSPEAEVPDYIPVPSSPNGYSQQVVNTEWHQRYTNRLATPQPAERGQGMHVLLHREPHVLCRFPANQNTDLRLRADLEQIVPSAATPASKRTRNSRRGHATPLMTSRSSSTLLPCDVRGEESNDVSADQPSDVTPFKNCDNIVSAGMPMCIDLREREQLQRTRLLYNGLVVNCTQMQQQQSLLEIFDGSENIFD